MTPEDLIKITGQHLLFLGVNAYGWIPRQFGQAAQFASTHGVDCLLVKVFDGANRWYGDVNWSAIAKAIQDQGVDVIPYGYSYGNKFGALDTEIDLMLKYMQDSGVFCADLEAEWNGRTDLAQQLCSRLQGQPGCFMVSTWADPSLQDWDGVIRALAPCTTVFMPQIYNNFLSQFWPEFAQDGAIWLQPTVNLTQDFGPNDPVTIAAAAHAQGHTAISVWCYDTAVTNPELLDQIYAAFPKGGTPVQTYGPGKGDFDTYFTANSDGSWTCKKTSAVLMGGNLALYQQCSIDGSSVPLPGLPLEGEQYHTESDGYQWSSQQCERATIYYDPEHRKDSQPGTGGSYLAHVNPPATTTVIPDALKQDIQRLPNVMNNLQLSFKSFYAKLLQDAGLPTA